MRVAVDEARHGRETTAVDLLELAAWCRQPAHRADVHDAAVVTEDVRVLEHVHPSQL
jgi:hypothetical protein